MAPANMDIDALHGHMRSKQPYYAIPTKFHTFDSLPTTANGKIDKRALEAIVGRKGNDAGLLAPPISGSASDVPSTPPSSYASSSDLSLEEKGIAREEEEKLDQDIPGKDMPQPLRGLVHRVFIVYRTLFSFVGLANLAALISVFVVGVDREWLNNLVAINLATAVLIRQDFVINALYTVTCSVPKTWPLAIRKRCAKIYHLGGIHSSAAVCAGAWLLAANISNVVCASTPDAVCPRYTRQSAASQAVNWLLSALFLVMVALAYPAVRKARHDLFERTHRFVGWTMLGLFWLQVVLATDDSRDAATPLGAALLSTPPFWLLLAATLSVATSWLFLRRVRVDAEVLSPHAARLHFSAPVPVNGTFVRLSHRPLLEWHSFATIPAPPPPLSDGGRAAGGYSLIVSNAGDWTRSLIQSPPAHIWTRGVPTCGVMRIATLFNSVVVVATGSGIGPCLGHIQQPTCDTGVIWSTSRPEASFGRGLLDEVRRRVPDAVVHDTKALGRPDLVRMAYNMARRRRAEAVIIIANEKITKKVVYGLESRGVPAYGAIWDS